MATKFLLTVSMPRTLADSLYARCRAEHHSVGSVVKGLIRAYIAGEATPMTAREIADRPLLVEGGASAVDWGDDE